MNLHKFDTKVQYLKYRALLGVARAAWEDRLQEVLFTLPKEIVPGKEATMRCCVFKERAVFSERIHLAMGGNPENPNVIEVLDIACDECPASGYEITDTCRGCIAHRCEEVCPKQAITFDEHLKGHIDKSKCINCGRCATVCPYSAIANRRRPCQNACKVQHTIGMAEDFSATIDNDRCLSCGSCVYQCPFGAIMDKSYILDAISMLKAAGKNHPLFAVVAPAVASQFDSVTVGQIFAGLKALGFTHVVETALGADMVARQEARELLEKGFLTTSCCPAFVSFVQKEFPQLAGNVSTTPSPMAMIGRYIKEHCPQAKVVFIGPCITKKAEAQKPEVKPCIDCVLTFEELEALFDSRELDLASLEDLPVEDASPFGRTFARSGGVTGAVRQALAELGADGFEFKPVVCNGIEECRTALLKAARGKLDGNFIEGMHCVGGCVNGSGCLSHISNKSISVDRFGAAARKKQLEEAVSSAQEIF